MPRQTWLDKELGTAAVIYAPIADRPEANEVIAGTLFCENNTSTLYVSDGVSDWHEIVATISTISVDMAGDVTGTSDASVVSKINGTTVTGTPGAAGAVFRATSTSAAAFGQVDLANANAITGVLATGHQASQTLSGDVTGTTAVSVVAKINGTTVSGTPGGTGAVFRALDVTSAAFGQLDLANTNSITGVLTTAHQANQTLLGDVTGTTDSSTVAKLQNVAVKNAAPSNNDVLTYVTANTRWEPVAPTTTTETPGNPGGRLSLSSGTSITTTDITAATNVYYYPHIDGYVKIYDGSSWVPRAFTIAALALGTLTSGKNYDVFGYSNAGVFTLELSAAWTSDTAREATWELALQNGVLVRTGVPGRRYLGTIRTTSTTTTEDSKAKRFCWNYYNRVHRSMSVKDSTDTWAYSTNAWRQANGSAANVVEAVVGATTPLEAHAVALGKSSIGDYISAGIGINQTGATDSVTTGATGLGVNLYVIQNSADYKGYLTSGYNYVAWLEFGGTGTTFYGDNGTTDGRVQSGLTAWVMG